MERDVLGFSHVAPSKTPQRKRPLQMADVMTRGVHSIGKTQLLDVAHALMRKHRLRHLPVLDRGALVGVISQRDLYFLEALPSVDLTGTTVEEAMSQDVYRVSPKAKVRDVAATMSEKKYGCAVVMDGTKVVGIFTTVDALRALAKAL